MCESAINVRPVVTPAECSLLGLYTICSMVMAVRLTVEYGTVELSTVHQCELSNPSTVTRGKILKNVMPLTRLFRDFLDVMLFSSRSLHINKLDLEISVSTLARLHPGSN